MVRVSKPPEERRLEIIDAAAALFERDGYENTNVSDIVRQVGVAQGLFYYYFKSKAEVLLSVFDRLLETRLESYMALLNAPDTTPLERVHNVVRGLGELFDRMEALNPVAHLGITVDTQRSLHRHIMDRLEPMMVRVLSEGAVNELLNLTPPIHFARFILGGFFSVQFAPEPPDKAEMTVFVSEIVERILALPSGSLLS